MARKDNMTMKAKGWLLTSQMRAHERNMRALAREHREDEAAAEAWFGMPIDQVSDEQWALFTQFAHEQMAARTVN